MPERLKRDWAGAIRRMLTEPNGQPPYRVQQATDCAWAFVAKWADYAEMAGMQPAHLLSLHDNPNRDGLAWRWSRHCQWWERWSPAWDVVCFPSWRLMVAENPETGTPFVYRFRDDGGVELVLGDDYRRVMGAQIELMARPNVQRQALAAEFVGD